MLCEISFNTGDKHIHRCSHARNDPSNIPTCGSISGNVPASPGNIVKGMAKCRTSIPKLSHVSSPSTI